MARMTGRRNGAAKTPTGAPVPASLGPVTVLPITAVRPSPINPRKIPQAAVDLVAKSLTTFGWQQPLVVDADHEVIVGHVRLLAAQQLKLAAVPAVIATHLTPAQVRAYRIADNRTGDFTSWDFPQLVAQLDELSEDFSDVLALTDWKAVVAELDAATDPAGELPNDQDQEDAAILDYLVGAYQITVVCDSEAAARRATAAVIDIPGVIDVRHKR